MIEAQAGLDGGGTRAVAEEMERPADGGSICEGDAQTQ